MPSNALPLRIYNNDALDGIGGSICLLHPSRPADVHGERILRVNPSSPVREDGVKIYSSYSQKDGRQAKDYVYPRTA